MVVYKGIKSRAAKAAANLARFVINEPEFIWEKRMSEKVERLDALSARKNGERVRFVNRYRSNILDFSGLVGLPTPAIVQDG